MFFKCIFIQFSYLFLSQSIKKQINVLKKRFFYIFYLINSEMQNAIASHLNQQQKKYY